MKRRSSVSSCGEGPSKPKGKGIDPCEWRNVNISCESLDIEAQAAALNSFKKQNEASKYPKEREPSRKKKQVSRDQEHGQRYECTRRHGPSRKSYKCYIVVYGF